MGGPAVMWGWSSLLWQLWGTPGLLSEDQNNILKCQTPSSVSRSWQIWLLMDSDSNPHSRILSLWFSTPRVHHSSLSPRALTPLLVRLWLLFHSHSLSVPLLFSHLVIRGLRQVAAFGLSLSYEFIFQTVQCWCLLPIHLPASVQPEHTLSRA